jgi:hypothetical protein
MNPKLPTIPYLPSDLLTYNAYDNLYTLHYILGQGI